MGGRAIAEVDFVYSLFGVGFLITVAIDHLTLNMAAMFEYKKKKDCCTALPLVYKE